MLVAVRFSAFGYGKRKQPAKKDLIGAKKENNKLI